MDEKKIYEKVKKKFSKGNYTTSIKLLNDLLSNNIDNLEIKVKYLTKLGACYLKLLNFDKAKEFIEYAYTIMPNNYYVLIELGNYYYDISEYNISISYYEKSLKKNLHHKKIYDVGIVYYAIARAYFKKENYELSDKYYHNYAKNKQKPLPLFFEKERVFKKINYVVEKLILKKDFESASKIIVKFLNEYGENLKFICNLAHCNIMLKNYSEAEKNLNLCLNKKYDSLNVYCELGKLFYFKDLDRSIKYYQKALQIDSSNIHILVKLGSAFIVKNPNTASLYLEKASTINPNNKGLLFAYGKLHKKLKNYNLAEEYFEKCYLLYPEFIPARYELGIINYITGNYTESYKFLEDIVNKKENNIDILIDMAKVLMKLDEYKKAEHILIKAYNKNLKNDIVFLEFARLNILLKKQEKAINYFQKALDVKPNNIYALLELGRLYAEFNNFDLSEYYYKQCILVKNDDLYAIFELGLLYYYYKKFDNAVYCFERALEIKPNDTYSIYFLGKVNEKEKNYINAIKHYKNYLNLKFDVDIIYRLAKVYLKLLNYNMAIYWFEIYLEKCPCKSFVLLRLGRLYSMKNKFNKAKICFEKILSIDSKNIVAKIQLSFVLKMIGDNIKSSNILIGTNISEIIKIKQKIDIAIKLIQTGEFYKAKYILANYIPIYAENNKWVFRYNNPQKNSAGEIRELKIYANYEEPIDLHDVVLVEYLKGIQLTVNEVLKLDYAMII